MVRATCRNNDGDLSGFAVEDNLGRFYGADDFCRVYSERNNLQRYLFRAAGDSAILKFDNSEIDYMLMFPQFENLSKGEEKILIGYAVSDEAGIESHGLSISKEPSIETGEARIEKGDGRCVVLRLRGKTFDGRYLIRPAFWGKKELVLFSRLG